MALVLTPRFYATKSVGYRHGAAEFSFTTTFTWTIMTSTSAVATKTTNMNSSRTATDSKPTINPGSFYVAAQVEAPGPSPQDVGFTGNPFTPNP